MESSQPPIPFDQQGLVALFFLCATRGKREREDGDRQDASLKARQHANPLELLRSVGRHSFSTINRGPGASAPASP